jgi:hypothetical protein
MVSVMDHCRELFSSATGTKIFQYHIRNQNISVMDLDREKAAIASDDTSVLLLRIRIEISNSNLCPVFLVSSWTNCPIACKADSAFGIEYRLSQHNNASLYSLILERCFAISGLSVKHFFM